MKFRALYRAAVLCTMLVSAATAYADTLVTRLVVWDTEGNRVAYDLTDNAIVKFSDDELLISAGDRADIRVPVSNVSHFTYETGSVTDVQSIMDDKEAEYTNGNLVFTLKAGENSIEIVDMNGAMIVSKTLRGNGERLYPLTGLQPGVYLVRFNGLTYKVIKR